MFKKTLVAAAVLSFCGAAQAAKVEFSTQNAPTFTTPATVKIAKEHVSAADTVFLADHKLYFQAEANFTDTDVLAFTFKGASPTLANFKPGTLRKDVDSDLLCNATSLDLDAIVNGQGDFLQLSLAERACYTVEVSIEDPANPGSLFQTSTTVSAGETFDPATYGPNDAGFVSASLVGTRVHSVVTTDTRVADLDLLSVSANTAGDTVVVYRVTNVDSVLGTNGARSTDLLNNLVFPGVTTSRAPITVSFEGKTVTGFAVDAAITNQALVNFETYLDGNLVVTKALGSDRRIDVNEVGNDPSRTTFVITPGGAKNRNDSLEVSISVNNTVAVAPTVTGVRYIISGDLAQLTTIDAGIPVSAFSSGGECQLDTINSSTSEHIFDCNSSLGRTFSVLVPGSGVIDVAEFAVSAEVKYTRTISSTPTTENSSQVYADKAAGIWRLNGSSVNIPYLPLSGTLEPVVIVSNNTNIAAGLQVDVRVNGQPYTNLTLTDANGQPLSVAANTSINVGDAIERAVRAATGNPTGTGLLRTNVTLVTNAPQDKVGVYSAYRNRAGAVRDLRVVVNTSNGSGVIIDR